MVKVFIDDTLKEKVLQKVQFSTYYVKVILSQGKTIFNIFTQLEIFHILGTHMMLVMTYIPNEKGKNKSQVYF